jgi:hypothetical protein
MHTFMRKMDTLFGYGIVNDPKKVIKFWKYGPPKGMRYGTKT